VVENVVKFLIDLRRYVNDGMQHRRLVRQALRTLTKALS
jgi:hypothetical protein